MERVSQEFYCGTCKGYCIIRLNTALDKYEVDIRCPNCGHEHRRHVYKGHVKERGRYMSSAREIIVPNKATYSKEPRTPGMIAAHARGDHTWDRCDLRRDGVLLETPRKNPWLKKLGLVSQ